MKKLDLTKFLEKFYNRYSDGLNLDLSEYQYTNMVTPASVTCKNHNLKYLRTPDELMRGIKGCKDCKSESISKSKSYTLEDFIHKSRKKHNNKYDYSKARWIDTRTKIDIICSKHGLFSQNPQNHWNGYGCPTCGYKKLRKSKESFIKEAVEIHGNLYSYKNVEYLNNYSPVSIVCKKHGTFDMTPVDHLIYQKGCPSCFLGNRSWKEIQWLNDLKVPEENRQKYIKINDKRLFVDGKVGNLIYEFWGDFWHGNPKAFDPSEKNKKCNKTFKELYESTMKKRKLILDAGYTLIEIWESDYDNDRKSK